MADHLPEFQRVQREFSSYIRDPLNATMPAGLAVERMEAYQNLFFNNMESFIATGFPVLKSLMDGDEWVSIVRTFYARHHCKTPLFLEIAEEFILYISTGNHELFQKRPFFLELAHYEWLELSLSVAMAEPPLNDMNPDLDFLEASIQLSPVARNLAYGFPVHRIGPNFQPIEKPDLPTFLVVYRDRDDRVRFIETNQVLYRLLQLVDESGNRPTSHLLRQLGSELQHPDPAGLLSFGRDLVRDLHEKGVIAVRS